jgi:hypothetical protein
MGTLTYSAGAASPIEIDDRTLAHLQVVIGAKLRTRQGFFFSWVEHAEKGSGRFSIWIEPSIQLLLRYDTAERHQLNRIWTESLMASANSTQGLFLSSEPQVIAVAA